jgi:hypothetical protein
MANMFGDAIGKSVELLHTIVPSAKRIAVLMSTGPRTSRPRCVRALFALCRGRWALSMLSCQSSSAKRHDKTPVTARRAAKRSLPNSHCQLLNSKVKRSAIAFLKASPSHSCCGYKTDPVIGGIQKVMRENRLLTRMPSMAQRSSRYTASHSPGVTT